MLVNETQFQDALTAANELTDEKLRAEAGGTGARSYYVVFKGRVLPLKTVMRFAYKREGFTWDGPHSNVAARRLKASFEILHITKQTERKRLERQRKSVERWARNPQFRADVLDLYGSTCVISGCSSLDAIDAAHILAVGSHGEDEPQNGVVFRSDLHRLFDAVPIKMGINPKSMTVHFDADCRDYYTIYEGRTIMLPKGGPKPKAFAAHWKEFRKGQKGD